MSSLDIVELACTIEEEYKIIIPDEDIKIFGGNIEQIIEYLTHKNNCNGREGN